MRFRPTGGLDLTTGALLVGGACLVALSIVAAVVLITPQAPSPPAASATPPQATPERAAAALPLGRVATVLSLDAAAGASAAARAGDHVDVLGYFPHQVTGADAVTRVLVEDVPVLMVDRSGPGVALTLSVEQRAALQLQEAQALGARPFVAVRPSSQIATLPPSFSDTDLARRVSGEGAH